MNHKEIVRSNFFFISAIVGGTAIIGYRLGLGRFQMTLSLIVFLICILSGANNSTDRLSPNLNLFILIISVLVALANLYSVDLLLIGYCDCSLIA